MGKDFKYIYDVLDKDKSGSCNLFLLMIPLFLIVD